MLLTDAEIRSAKAKDKTLKLFDGGGLFLLVTPAGSRGCVRKLVTRAGQLAEFDFPVHPHMLRHACGFKLANDGQDTRAIQHYIGHRNIHNTSRYTELATARFRHFWKD
ncbi:MAG: integrase family protein [Gammaproteobacteria bacterium]|nr:integrase family protein [Gammaproteobacteria bacterium]